MTYIPQTRNLHTVAPAIKMAISKHQTAFALLLIVALLPSLAAASGRMLRSSGYSNDIGEVSGVEPLA